jgi:hypothetical protein
MNGMEWIRHAVGLLAVLLAVVAVPWAGMRMLRLSLAEGSRIVRNYRGREVPLGLGLVWVFWAVALAAHQVLVWAFGLPNEYTASLWFEITIVVPLVLGAFMFGLIDDTFGTAGHKGFRGHLSALRHGRLTTGALKLFGIGFLALLGAAFPAFGAGDVTPQSIAHYVIAVLVIGLAANTVNLFDLRPGRALKAYSVFVVVSVPLGAWSLLVDSEGLPLASAVFDGLFVLAIAVGPVLAVWGQDVREEAMLGDAGANAFGMLAGLLLVSALPFAGAIAAAATLLALNLVSEKVSFTSVIERTPWLAALDRWGRPTDTPAP